MYDHLTVGCLNDFQELFVNLLQMLSFFLKRAFNTHAIKNCINKTNQNSIKREKGRGKGFCVQINALMSLDYKHLESTRFARLAKKRAFLVKFTQKLMVKYQCTQEESTFRKSAKMKKDFFIVFQKQTTPSPHIINSLCFNLIKTVH